jgi:hypothetical protein
MGEPLPPRVYTEKQFLDCARLRHGPTVTRAVLAVLADLAERHHDETIETVERAPR